MTSSPSKSASEGTLQSEIENAIAFLEMTLYEFHISKTNTEKQKRYQTAEDHYHYHLMAIFHVGIDWTV